jgi:hypothetical protein
MCEEDMKIMGIKDWYRAAGDDGEEWRGLYWKPRFNPEWGVCKGRPVAETALPNPFR